MIGKPYSVKPNVRFDEGELEIEHSATTPALYSTVTNNFADLESGFLFLTFILKSLVSIIMQHFNP
jgi:hypothetical protein